MSRSTSTPAADAFLEQDRDARLQVGRADVGDQSPLESAAQPVLQRRQLLGWPVGGDDDLLRASVQLVERVEELLLRALLVLQELDVVDQQDVDVAVARAELLLPVVTDRVDEFVRELLGVHVADPQLRMHLRGVVGDRVQQVGLAETGVAVDEQRVVGTARRFGDGDGSRMRKAVAVADHERLEGVALVQLRRRAPAPTGR